jgi:hypothetical protein
MEDGFPYGLSRHGMNLIDSCKSHLGRSYNQTIIA